MSDTVSSSISHLELLYFKYILLKIKFRDIAYEYHCNTHEIFYQTLKININLNFLIVNKIVAGCRFY